MKKAPFVIASLLLLCPAAQAQEKWTLRQCIDHAVEHNIEIKQQELTVQSAEVDLNTSRNSRLPNLSAGASQNFNFGRSPSMATGIYEENRSTSTSVSLSSSVPVFSGMRINNEIKSNRLNLKAATENLKKAKENLELQVTSLFLDVLFKKEIHKVYIEQAQLTRQQVERTEMLVQSGKVPESQLYDIRSQLAKDEVNSVMAGNDVDLSLLNLSQALNFETGKSFDIDEPDTRDVIARYAGSIQSPDKVYQIAIDIKPHVREAELRLESSRYEMKTVQARLWPTLTLGLSYNNGINHVFDRNYDNKPISQQIKNNQREAIGFSLNVPIFSRLATRNQIRTARLNVQNRSYELDNVKLALYKEIQQAYQSAVAAQAKYAATERSLEAAQTAYKYAEERYSVGKSTVYEFNDALTKMLTSRSEQLQSKYEFLFRAQILDFYRGMPIDIR